MQPFDFIGAQGRNRTTDTRIFRAPSYHLYNINQRLIIMRDKLR
jgi:hypothetical protein